MFPYFKEPEEIDEDIQAPEVQEGQEQIFEDSQIQQIIRSSNLKRFESMDPDSLPDLE